MLCLAVYSVLALAVLSLGLDCALARPDTAEDVADTLKDVNLEDLIKILQSALPDIINAQTRNVKELTHAQEDLSLEELLMPKARTAAQPRTLDVILRVVRFFERVFIKILGI